MCEIINIPIIVNGRKIEDTGIFHEIQYDTGVILKIPKLTSDLEQEILDKNYTDLADIPIDDITIFLNEVGEKWADTKFELHQQAVELASKITGYNKHIFEEDFQRIARTMRRQKLYDLIDGDLGNYLYLDEWIPSQSVYVKAKPKGVVTHIMVGNVPLAGLFTIVRSILCKNRTIAKLPSRDLVSCLYFALTFLAVDSDNPVTKSLSVVYWSAQSDFEKKIIAHSNVVCAWGQGKSIGSIKKEIPYGVDFVEFGPKESFHIIDADYGDIDDVCMRVAYDVCVYEQEACFSAQRVFVKGNVDAFTECLSKWMVNIKKRLPVGIRSQDKKAEIKKNRMNAKFSGFKVIDDGTLDWSIIVTEPGEWDIIHHPLARTIYVHPVDKLEEAIEYANKETQSVGVSPWAKGMEMADRLADRGALRVVEVGLMSRPRPGFTHDGMKSMNNLVRWISVERGLDYKGKHRATSKSDFEKGLFKKGM